jgi:hypothetical protein
MTTLSKTAKLQDNIAYLFIAIWICALIGFHKTYTIFFPAFEGFHWEQHFHGTMLMAWFGMLIIQPLLIRYRKNKIHRALGKAGYILAPLVCYSIFLVTKMVYHREIAVRPENSVLSQLSLDIPTIFIFGLFFILAMVNRHNSGIHMRYMIGTSLLMVGPGLGRALIIFGGIPFPLTVSIVYYISEIVAVLLLLNDVRNKANLKPMLTVTIILIINHIIWAFQESVLWLTIARWFANIAF